ncbi:MAG: hypothetical protein LIO70_08695, partial [Clostridiales bacterium]|nr:hypothetical protein [Clostridiales bacterium]
NRERFFHKKKKQKGQLSGKTTNGCPFHFSKRVAVSSDNNVFSELFTPFPSAASGGRPRLSEGFR